MLKVHFNFIKIRKPVPFVWISLAMLVVAFVLGLLFRVPLPMVPAHSQNGLGEKIGILPLERDKRVLQYGPCVPSFPEFNELGEGELTEAQQREFFKFHTGIEVPSGATKWDGRYEHGEIQRYKELYGRQFSAFILPADQALALFNNVKTDWALKHPQTDEGAVFSAGPFKGPGKLSKYDSNDVSGEKCLVYPYKGKFDTVTLYLSPTTGRVRIERNWGEA